MQGWKEHAVVKTAFCSCREPTLSSQHPHVSSQPSITLVAGDLIPFLTFVGSYMQVKYIYTETHTHIPYNKYFLKNNSLNYIARFFCLQNNKNLWVILLSI